MSKNWSPDGGMSVNVNYEIARAIIEKENEKMVENDDVNAPSHYKDGGIETIDFIEAKKLGYHLANVVKYVSRAGKKDPSKYKEDLEKALWYLTREIHSLEKE